MIDYTSVNMPTIPTMYDINDLFANFANNWYHLRFVLSLLFGITFGFWLLKKILEGLFDFADITQASWRAKDAIALSAERLKEKTAQSAERMKQRAEESLTRGKEKSEKMLQLYSDNYMRKMEIRHEAKFNFGESVARERDEQRKAVVFLAALGARKQMQNNDY